MDMIKNVHNNHSETGNSCSLLVPILMKLAEIVKKKKIMKMRYPM